MVAEQLIFNGIIAGGIYSLIAIGFSMTYGLLRFLNIAHGALYAIGAYTAFFFFSIGVPIVGAFLLAILVGALAGACMNYTVFRPLRRKKSSSLIMLIASIAIYMLVENLIIGIFGAKVHTIRTGPITQGIDIFGAIITQTQIYILATSLITLVVVDTFLQRTKLGKAMRATADNSEVAQVIGINTDNIATYSFVLVSMLAASAGVLIAIEQNLEPTMGLFALVSGLIAAIVGGLGSVRGAVAGAFMLGIAENIGIWFLPSGYKGAIAFIILVAFLLFRPQGIFGRRET